MISQIAILKSSILYSNSLRAFIRSRYACSITFCCVQTKTSASIELVTFHNYVHKGVLPTNQSSSVWTTHRISGAVVASATSAIHNPDEPMSHCATKPDGATNPLVSEAEMRATVVARRVDRRAMVMMCVAFSSISSSSEKSAEGPFTLVQKNVYHFILFSWFCHHWRELSHCKAHYVKRVVREIPLGRSSHFPDMLL